MINKITGTAPKIFRPLKKTALASIAALSLTMPGFAQKNDYYEQKTPKTEQAQKSDGDGVYGTILGILGIIAGIGYATHKMSKSDKEYERKVREEAGL